MLLLHILVEYTLDKHLLLSCLNRTNRMLQAATLESRIIVRTSLKVGVVVANIVLGSHAAYAILTI